MSPDISIIHIKQINRGSAVRIKFRDKKKINTDHHRTSFDTVTNLTIHCQLGYFCLPKKYSEVDVGVEIILSHVRVVLW